MLALAFGAYGQRRITPIKNPDNTPVAADSTKTKGTTKLPDGTEVPERPASVVEMKDMHGHVVLVDTISGVEYRDTILTQAPKLIYPLRIDRLLGRIQYPQLVQAVCRDWAWYGR